LSCHRARQKANTKNPNQTEQAKNEKQKTQTRNENKTSTAGGQLISSWAIGKQPNQALFELSVLSNLNFYLIVCLFCQRLEFEFSNCVGQSVVYSCRTFISECPFESH